MTERTRTSGQGRFDIAALAATLPDSATTMLADRYVVDGEAASARVFRVYRPTPPHYHANCDEHLYVISGRGLFWMEDRATEAEFRPGHLIVFRRGTVHAMSGVLEEPVVMLAIDTPRRDPRDIVFVDPAAGTAESFMARNAADDAPSTD